MYPSDPPTYLADSSGSLIGLVHDPMTIIEHQLGLGIGAYGSILGNSEILPPVGTRMTLIVAALPGVTESADPDSSRARGGSANGMMRHRFCTKNTIAGSELHTPVEMPRIKFK